MCVRVRACMHVPTHDKTGHENKESDLTCGNEMGGVYIYLLGVYEVRTMSEGSAGGLHASLSRGGSGQVHKSGPLLPESAPI